MALILRPHVSAGDLAGKREMGYRERGTRGGVFLEKGCGRGTARLLSFSLSGSGPRGDCSCACSVVLQSSGEGWFDLELLKMIDCCSSPCC